MPKYIDADALKEKLRQVYYDDFNRDLLSVVIDDTPAAAVAEVRHGRWVQSDLDKDFVTCSECKRMKLQNRMAWNLNTAEHWGLHYCPNCGAKMSGPEGGENADK